MGDVTFTINYMGKAHSDGDLSMLVEPDMVLFSGDILIFEGRVPFVGSSDTKNWLDTLTKLETSGLTALSCHGPASTNETIALTQLWLTLREVMGAAVDEFIPFDEAYADADWSSFRTCPRSQKATVSTPTRYLSMEAELLGQ